LLCRLRAKFPPLPANPFTPPPSMISAFRFFISFRFPFSLFPNVDHLGNHPYARRSYKVSLSHYPPSLRFSHPPFPFFFTIDSALILLILRVFFSYFFLSPNCCFFFHVQSVLFLAHPPRGVSLSPMNPFFQNYNFSVQTQSASCFLMFPVFPPPSSLVGPRFFFV